MLFSWLCSCSINRVFISFFVNRAADLRRLAVLSRTYRRHFASGQLLTSLAENLDPFAFALMFVTLSLLTRLCLLKYIANSRLLMMGSTFRLFNFTLLILTIDIFQILTFNFIFILLKGINYII